MGLKADLEMVSDSSTGIETVVSRPSLDTRPAQTVSGLVTSPFAIRLPTAACDVACRLCGQEFAASGPTGFHVEEPVCDHCLLVEEPHLGMVLALVAVARMHAAVWPESEQEEQSIQAELSAFARVYDRFAARLGPPRPVVDRARRESTDG